MCDGCGVEGCHAAEMRQHRKMHTSSSCDPSAETCCGRRHQRYYTQISRLDIFDALSYVHPSEMIRVREFVCLTSHLAFKYVNCPRKLPQAHIVLSNVIGEL